MTNIAMEAMAHRNRWSLPFLKMGGSYHGEPLVITRWYHLAWDHIKAWMYLQPIFDSPDIMKQLPTEGKKFKVVDGREGPGKSQGSQGS
jgi:hypothetical protein